MWIIIRQQKFKPLFKYENKEDTHLDHGGEKGVHVDQKKLDSVSGTHKKIKSEKIEW